MIKTTIKEVITRSRVLEKISSRHGTRDLSCQFSGKIYYSYLTE